MSETPGLEDRVAALEAAVAMLTRKSFESGDLTINDARVALGLPPFDPAGFYGDPVKGGCKHIMTGGCPLDCFSGPCMFEQVP